METQDDVQIQYDNKRVNKVFKKMLTLQGDICARNAIVKNNYSTDMKRTEIGNIETANEEAKSSSKGTADFEREFMKNYKNSNHKKIFAENNIFNIKAIKLGDNYNTTEIKETHNIKQKSTHSNAKFFQRQHTFVLLADVRYIMYQISSHYI